MTDPIAPPVDSTYEPMPVLPKWPKVVGILSIVFGSLGLLCNGIGTVGAMFQGTLMNLASQQSAASGGPPMNFPDFMTRIDPVMITLMLVATGWALFLLVAGVLLANRRPAARPLHLLYSVGGVLLVLVGLAVQLNQLQQTRAWVAANPSEPFAQSFNPTGNYIGMAFGILIGMGYPAFCLIWFALVKRRATDITAGLEEPAA